MSSSKPPSANESKPDLAFAETLQDPSFRGDEAPQSRQQTSLLQQALLVLEQEGTEAALALQEQHHRHRYIRRGPLGEGGMGVVDLVWDRTLCREVAQKRLQKSRSSSAHAVQNFVVEARVVALLDHPNIIPIHDLGINEAGEVYLTMKRVQGQSLAEDLQQQAHAQVALTRELIMRRLRLFVQLCHAVAYAHRQGILHRDLKPGNLLIGTFGELYLTDWGLAVPLPHMPEETRKHLFGERAQAPMAGTPHYMPPEALQESPPPASETNDIYALGIILFELLSPEVPFLGQQITHLQNEKRSFLPYSLPHRWPLYNASLAAIVEKAAHPMAERRYESVTALREDIERYLDGLSPYAEDAGFLKKFSVFYFRKDQKIWHPSPLHIDILLLVALLFGISMGAWYPDYFPSWLRWLGLSLGILTAIAGFGLAFIVIRSSSASLSQERTSQKKGDPDA
ncbi:MAG: protein kinase [Myxococcales bacterium]|nr:protein kinase [Myxococcales bacterium]